MFTGIVEEVGSVAQVHKLDSGALGLTVSASIPFVNALHVGDSVSVSGCCLTVVERATVSGGTFRVELIEETLSRTAPKWTPGSDVNLEQAMRAGGALGGHVVTGHVDGVAEVVAVDITPGASVIRFRAPAALAAQLVPKGSVTVDGVSLTLVDVGGPGGSRPDWPPADFSVALIPHTLAVTTLGALRSGDSVNVETDVIAKHVKRILALREVGHAG